MYRIGRFAVVSKDEKVSPKMLPIVMVPHYHQAAFPWWDQSTANVLGTLPDDLTGKRVLDYGCGASAILAIAAARLGASDVRAVEIHPELAALARANIEANGLPIVLEDDDGSSYDLILANIGDEDAVKALRSRGTVIGTNRDGDLV